MQRTYDRQFLRAVLDAAVDAMLLCDDEGRYVEANDAACTLFGLTREELLARKATEFRGSDPRESAEVWRAFLESGTLERESVLTRPDGGQRTLEVKATANVVPGLHVAVLRDVTERRGAAELLEDSRQLLESAQALAHVGTWMSSPEGEYRSAEHARICGQPVDTACDVESYLRAVHPDDRESLRRKLSAALEGGNTYENEYRVVRPDGTVRWVQSHAARLGGGEGRPARIVGAVQDVTERRLLVDELRASEQRYRRLIDALSEGVLLIDPDGRIRLANAHMGAMLGATADDIVGQSAFRFLEEGEHDTARERLAQRTRGIGGRYLSRIVRKDGVSIPVSCRVDPVLDAEGRCEGMVTIVQDLSERHAAEEVRGQLARTEEQLRHSQKMEAVGLLAGGVAHDFNNLLSIVLSYAELLRDGLEPDDPRRADADEIRNAGEKAASLTRQLLAFSRKQVLQPRVMDLNETILGMQKMLRRLLGEDVELTLLPAERLGRVHADPCHIEQVVMNLAVNARDAMPRGGELTMRTENVALDPDEASSLGLPPGAYVCLSVEDDGCGMDAATRERIFEPFFTTKKEGCGTGLGLSTVFGIVRQSGGQVAVRSEPGHGATFRVYLPRRDASASLPCNTLPGDAGLEGTETILLVEDDEQVRRVVGAALRRRGYTLLQAQNAGEAMLVAERHDGPIHLLLTDVVMPVVSGRELAERLVPLIHGLRVLFMSGYTPDAVLRHGVREGSAAFVQKPVTPQLLAAKVREVLRIPVDQAAE